MNQFYDIAISGFLVGVLISAPMGPVGVLIIQRTLSKGRWPAFITGCGAAISDLFYCLLTGLGLSFIIDVITKNTNLQMLIGSIAIAGYAAFLFLKKQIKKTVPPKNLKKSSLFADFCTGFFFTFSNPLILVLITYFFTHFNFLQPEYMAYHYVVGYVGIIVGALCWWYIITFAIDKVRERFNEHSILTLNRIIATVLFVMAAYGCVAGIQGLLSAHA